MNANFNQEKTKVEKQLGDQIMLLKESLFKEKEKNRELLVRNKFVE